VALAQDLMSSPVTTIQSTATVGDAADLMLEGGFSCLPVVDEKGELAGMLTHTDFSMHHRFKPLAQNLYSLLGSWGKPEAVEEIYHDIRSRKISDVMSHPVSTVKEETPVTEVVESMLRNHVNRVPVMRAKTVVGIITRHDLLKLISMDT
jgi:CBS domain-containing protein